tara:strand:- start:785 stop:1261 length:477 start_codon:yes stop_codon:yes gene_type:complete
MRKKLKFEDISKYLNNIIIFDEIIIKKNIEVKNQLFRENIEIEFLEKLIKDCFNIELNNSTYYSFSKKTITSRNVLEVITNNMEKLQKYYIKCKHKIYLENLNEKKIITLLRQLLRFHEFELRAKEKYENGKKYLLYTICKKMDVISLKKIDSTINFD